MDEFNKGEVRRFVAAIEEGNLPVSDAYNLLITFDSLLSFFLLNFLRECHPVTDTSSGPGSRLLELLTTYPDVAKLTKPPQGEAMVEWFNDTYSYREFISNKDEFIEMIIEKLEG